MKQALDLGSKIINEQGGINGRKLKIITYDNALTVPKGLLAVQKLINQDHVFTFVLLMGNPFVKAVQQKIYDSGRAIMFPIAPLESLYNPPQHLLVAYVPDFAEQFAAATKWAVEKKGKKRVCLLEAVGLNANVHGAVDKELAAHHLKLASYQSYSFGSVDLSSQVARLHADNCDVVLLDSIVRDAAAALRERAKLGWNVDYIVAQSAGGNGLIRLGGKAAEGTYALATAVPLNSIKDRPIIKTILKRYDEEYHKPFQEAFLGGYEGLLLLAEALKNAGPDLTTESMIAGADKIKDFDPGLGFPPMTITEKHRLGSHHGYIVQLRNGEWHQAASY
jgi:ABC-type branched-subunit amino acid transport system substrate-binding protein